jgi:hypothetical protein
MDDAHPSELAGAASSSTKQSKIARRGVGRASRYNRNVKSSLNKLEIINYSRRIQIDWPAARGPS